MHDTEQTALVADGGESRYAIDAQNVEVTYGGGTEAVRGVNPELTARENTRFACEACGVPRSERERIDELLDPVLGAVAVVLLTRATGSSVEWERTESGVSRVPTSGTSGSRRAGPQSPTRPSRVR